MKTLNEYIKKGIVKKQLPNRERAFAILKEVNEKKNFLELSLKSIPGDKMNANFVVDYCYDILMELIRAKMFFDGFNAGNSHEAEISYLSVLNFLDPEINFMDELRYYRNGTKYYGTVLSIDYAKKVLDFMKKNYSKLLKFIV